MEPLERFVKLLRPFCWKLVNRASRRDTFASVTRAHRPNQCLSSLMAMLSEVVGMLLVDSHGYVLVWTCFSRIAMACHAHSDPLNRFRADFQDFGPTLAHLSNDFLLTFGWMMILMVVDMVEQCWYERSGDDNPLSANITRNIFRL